jgi:hypothetical protein
MEMISYIPLEGVPASDLEKARELVKLSRPDQRQDFKDIVESADVTPPAVTDVVYKLTVGKNPDGGLTGVIYASDVNGGGNKGILIEAPGIQPEVVQVASVSREVNAKHRSILIKHRLRKPDGSFGEEMIAGVIFWQSDQCKPNGAAV